LVGRRAARTEDGLDSVVEQIIKEVRENQPVTILPDNEEITKLLRILRDDYEVEKRINAVRELKKFNELRVIDALIEAVKYDKKVRYEALVALTHLKSSRANDNYILRIEDPSSRIRHISILGLGDTGKESAIPPLQTIVDTFDFWHYNQKRPDGKGQRTNWGKSENVVLAEKAIDLIKERLVQYRKTQENISLSVKEEVTLEKVKIEASIDTIVRGNDFFVTITGKPNTQYFLWVKDTHPMSGNSGDQPPIITAKQLGVFHDPISGPFTIGEYQFENGDGKTIRDDVPSISGKGTQYYALVQLPDTGIKAIWFNTSADTKAKKYTVSIERKVPGSIFGSGRTFISDSVDISVEKGAVTIVMSGDQSYTLGDEVHISGTNSDSEKVFLFITGPNIPTSGGNLTDPRKEVVNGTPESFIWVDVHKDKTWEYVWDTSGLILDAGLYAIFAVSSPNDKNTLTNSEYGSVSLILRKQFVTAQASQSSISQGDTLFIDGIASGKPSAGVAIWIIGPNFIYYTIKNVNSDCTFKHKSGKEITKNLSSGLYFAVIQHPMYNDRFDIYPLSDKDYPFRYVAGPYPRKGFENIIFTLQGPGSLQLSDAVNALTVALDNPSVDDTYTKFQFLIDEPQINIIPITQKIVGDKFTIQGTTNLAENDELLVEIYSSSFWLTMKDESGNLSGASGKVKVMKGSQGFNIWAFPLDTSSFKPDRYSVKVSSLEIDVRTMTSFEIIEK
jgi:hypothetical protein